MTKHGPWMQTVSGRAFDLLDPSPDRVLVEDVAGHLARINRFSGATRGQHAGLAVGGYSVAQHSVLVSDLLASWGAPTAIVREGLLHDAGEAYYGDITAPVKDALRALRAGALDTLFSYHGFTDEQRSAIALAFDEAALGALTRSVDEAVRVALRLPRSETPLVKRADLVALAIERRDLMAACDRDWDTAEYADKHHSVDKVLTAHAACHVFMERLKNLDAVLEYARADAAPYEIGA